MMESHLQISPKNRILGTDNILMKHRGSTAAGPPHVDKTSRIDPPVDPHPTPGDQPPRVYSRWRPWIPAVSTCQTKKESFDQNKNGSNSGNVLKDLKDQSVATTS